MNDLPNFVEFYASRQGGLNEHARRVCKNLEYAIAIANRPGAIEYYQPPIEIQRVVENGDLAVLNGQIKRVQSDLDQVTSNVASVTKLKS